MIETLAPSEPVQVGFMDYSEIECLRRAHIRFWSFEETDHGASVWVEALDVPFAVRDLAIE